MNKIIILLLFIEIGCTNYHYVSSPVYVPLNREKKEVKINISSNFFHLGYSLFNHYSIFVNGNRGLHEISDIYRPEDFFQGHDKSNEIILGNSFFVKKNIFTYELLVGTGKGKFEYTNWFWSHNYHLAYYTFSLKSNKINYFIQPDIGINVNKILEIGVFSNFSYVNYYNIKTTKEKRYSFEDIPQDDFFLNKSEECFKFISPGIVCKLGFKNIKGQVTVSRTYMLSPLKNIKYKKSNISLSIFIDLDILNKKEKKTESNL